MDGKHILLEAQVCLIEGHYSLGEVILVGLDGI